MDTGYTELLGTEYLVSRLEGLGPRRERDGRTNGHCRTRRTRTTLNRVELRMMHLQPEWWTRTHRTPLPVTLSAVTSPINSEYVVSADGWELPSRFSLLHPTREVAQRAADDVLLAYLPHDCRVEGCGHWTPNFPLAIDRNCLGRGAPNH